MDTSQITIGQAFQKVTAHNKVKLLKKIQLAHFIGIRCLPATTYEYFAEFEKIVHNVDLGGGYLNRVSFTEIISFLAKDILIKNITRPFNTSL